MGRLPLTPDQPSDQVLSRIFEELRRQGRVPPNLYLTLGHAPKMLEAWVGMAWPLRSEPSVPAALRELMIMRIAQLTRADYEWAHHWGRAVEAGVPEARLHSLAAWRSSEAFTERERSVLAYAEEIAANDVRDDTFTDLAGRFPPAEVIELTLTASFYTCVARVLRALRVDVEPGFDEPLRVLHGAEPLAPAVVAGLLRASASAVAAEVRALPAHLVGRRPPGGGWCALELVGHLIEAERRGFAGRIRLLVAGGEPRLEPWDQPAVAAARHDRERDPEALVEELLALREDGARMLEGLSPADLERAGVHPVAGRLTVAEVMHEWLHHDRAHLKQLLELGQAFAWEHMGHAQRFSRWARPIEIVPYDPAWARRFEAERDRLAAALGELVVAIEHIGSTSVPGQAAKPIIDVAVVITGEADVPEAVALAQGLGYERWPRGDFAGRVYLQRLEGEEEVVHLSLTTPAAPYLPPHILFRDRLRAEPALVEEYAELKRRLTVEHPHDRLAYTMGKTAFIERVCGVGWVD